MLDEKKVNESKRRIEQWLKNGELVRESHGKFVEFFLSNAKNYFDSSRLLYNASTKEDLKKVTGFPNFNGFL